MNRKQFKELALIRLKEAEILLKNKKYNGAYYLCGYSIECGLKACIAKNTKRHSFPERDVKDSCYTHNFKELLKTAGLENIHKDSLKKDKKFDINWTLVKDWTEESRYNKIDVKKAKTFYDAVADEHNGVLQWIKQRW